MAEIAPKHQKKGKRWRGPKLNTNQLEVVEGLGELHGLLRDSAVWMALDHDTVFKLDTLCYGNLDGGPGTAAGVRRRLGDDRCRGDKAVRLALDEAFFMAHALGVLHVHTPVAGADLTEQLDSDALWRACMTVRPDFLPLYLAYSHFRSKGWIPRTGLQYGADFVLYQKHPALSHSDYAVLVLPLYGPRVHDLGWHDLQVANRLSGQVSKKLILLFVQCNGALDTSSWRCLPRFSVQERMIRRWVPESHRPVT